MCGSTLLQDFARCGKTCAVAALLQYGSQFFSTSSCFFFLADQDSSIGDLVTQSVSETHLISDYNDYKTRVTTETVFNDLVT